MENLREIQKSLALRLRQAQIDFNVPQGLPDAKDLSLPQLATPSFDLNKVMVTFPRPLRNVRLKDVLEVIVQVADRPIKYSVEDYGVVFSPNLERVSDMSFSHPSAESGRPSSRPPKASP